MSTKKAAPHKSPRRKPPVKKSPAEEVNAPPAWLAPLCDELVGTHNQVEVPRLKKGARLTHKQAFLAAFVRTASVTRAAKAAGVCREMHYQWKDTDPAYAANFAVAREKAGESLEDEAVRRAYQGTLKPVYYVGQLCGAVREYSDGLLSKLLSANLPEKYRERFEHIVTRKRFSGSLQELLDLYRKTTAEEGS